MKIVQLAPHEFSANLLFNEDGLAPLFALDAELKAGGGSKTATFQLGGDHWKARLSYDDSNLLNPGSRTPLGTEWQLEEMREYRIKVKRSSGEDDAGQQRFSTHITPRWPGLKGEKGGGDVVEIPVPEGFGEGINVRVQGSNIAFDRYVPLLRQAAVVLGINGRYFDEPHEYSNIQDAERYVRVHRNASRPVHARDGPIASMAHLLEHDRRDTGRSSRTTLTSTTAISPATTTP